METIFGSNAPDTLEGTGGQEWILGWDESNLYPDDGPADDHDLLRGLGGDDHLDGGGGNDSLEGGEGDDLLYGDEFSLTGAGRDQLFGGAGNDTLFGGDGNDTLQGGIGDDLLAGGRGHDRFDFVTAPDRRDIDIIYDFDSDMDLIRLSAAAFDALPLGNLRDHAFALGRNALDHTDRVLYDPETGEVRYDADGRGGREAVLFLTMAGALPLEPLTADDFKVI